MRLTIAGNPNAVGVTHNIIREALNYYKGLLGPEFNRTSGELSIRVNFIQDLLKQYGGTGFCSWTDNNNGPKKFLIEIDADLKLSVALITAAHELVHVMQLALGHRYQSFDRSNDWWMGRMIDQAATHYYDLPWEIDALGREYGLYDRFIRKGHTEDTKVA